MKMMRSVCCVVALTTMFTAQLQAARSHVLANEHISVTISGDGKLESVANLLAAETYSFRSDSFALDTDLGQFSNRNVRPTRVTAGKNRIVCHYEFGPGGANSASRISADLVYTLAGNNGFFRRTLSISNTGPLRVRNLVLGETSYSSPPEESVHYLTFWMAPTVEFIRHRNGGLFTGIENPFYQADLDEKRVALSFQPGLILRAGEGYESEPQFMGVYRKSGVMIEDSGRPFRYPNGSGYIPIDRNESRAMRAFALDYLAPAQKRLLNINYQFFHPLPQMPANDADKLYFTKAIDAFADIGGDMIIFNPLHRYTKPDEGRDYWNVLPDEQNATARQIADYAVGKGIPFGFYMGCAAHGGEGNAAGLPFRPDKPDWKKMDAQGRRAPDNCLAGDDFYDWWFTVQDNTISRYKLSNWSWDPSRGSGMNCYDEKHGHLAGLGAYKGWRRCMELGKRLKQSHPGLFIQAFYGTKQFGLWGLKDVDGHEVYNEQTACVSTHHTQISDDRQNADGLRFQNYWSMRFRFLPTVMGHPLVGRMSEGPWDRELVKACDFYGWQYSLMSALAISGSIMPAILPYESSLLPGYQEFYHKWTAWAKTNFDYVQYTEPFGEQVQAGAVDGYARIKGDHGYIFLFNGNPRPSESTFEVGDEINLQEKGVYELVELYPAEVGMIVLDNEGHSRFALGQKARLTVPANSCRLLELRRAAEAKGPVLVGMVGRVELDGDRLDITGVRGKPGQVCSLGVRLAKPASVKRITVNGVEQPFARADKEIRLTVQFAGDAHVRELDHWTKPDGSVFSFPNDQRQDSLNISAKFTINKDVPELLEKAKPGNFSEMDSRIADWQTRGSVSPYHNFTCCRPNRLWLVIPFTLQKVSDVKVTINSRELAGLLKFDGNGHSFYADITEVAGYGGDNEIKLSLRNMEKNEFMGPFLMYPDEGLTSEVLPKPGSPEPRVVYTGSLIPRVTPRYLAGAKRPVITQAMVTGNVTLTRPTQLQVSIDLPPDKIREVNYTESGFAWMSISGLGYNQGLKCWTADVRPGPRASIQESEYIYVWAVGTNGLHSDYCPVKVGWDFTTRSASPKKVAGAIEAESLKVQSVSRGRVEPQDMSPFGNHWSDDSQMVWWGGLTNGDQLVLEVPVDKAGSYELQLHLSRAEDYGIFSFQLDDGPESKAIDLFEPKLQPPMLFKLKPAMLTQGSHRLKILYHGKHPDSRNSLIGIDCLELKSK